MKNLIIYGTESGTAELVAEEIVENCFSDEEEVKVQDMADTEIEDICSTDRLFVICSTYGEGDLPATAEPFIEKLMRESPNLTGTTFVAYGLGDSFYSETYNGGIHTVVEKLQSLGAQLSGEVGLYDTSGEEDPVEAAEVWFNALKIEHHNLLTVQ